MKSGFSADFGSVQTLTKVIRDYEGLEGKPKINGVELLGDIPLQELGLRAVYYDSKANWDSQHTLITEEGALYIYSDYKVEQDQEGNSVNYPAIKIGDGTTYLIDLPVTAGGNSGVDVTDYLRLTNKPQINNVTLQGNLPLVDLGLRPIYYGTRASWDQQAGLISEAGALYIYSDYKIVTSETGESTVIPGIRVGDGTTYLVDLPFISESNVQTVIDSLSESNSLVTPQDREFWDGKVSARVEAASPETLVLFNG